MYNIVISTTDVYDKTLPFLFQNKLDVFFKYIKTQNFNSFVTVNLISLTENSKI